MRPLVTRLRFIKAKRPEDLTIFLASLKFRVQIYGNPVWDGKAWFLWVVPPDDEKIDLKNVDLT